MKAVKETKVTHWLSDLMTPASLSCYIQRSGKSHILVCLGFLISKKPQKAMNVWLQPMKQRRNAERGCGLALAAPGEKPCFAQSAGIQERDSKTTSELRVKSDCGPSLDVVPWHPAGCSTLTVYRLRWLPCCLVTMWPAHCYHVPASHSGQGSAAT